MKNTPLHSINMDFLHSSEAQALLDIVSARICPKPEAEDYLNKVEEQLTEAIELLQSMEE